MGRQLVQHCQNSRRHQPPAAITQCYCEARGMYLVLLLHSCVVDTLQVVKTWQKLGKLPSQQLCFYLTAYRGWSVRKSLCIIYNLLQTETSLNNAETSTIYGCRNISIQKAVLQQQQLPWRVCVASVHAFLTRFIVPGIDSLLQSRRQIHQKAAGYPHNSHTTNAPVGISFQQVSVVLTGFTDE